MKVNFDEKIDRFGTNSLKWDLLDKLYGDKDIMSMWVADSDFKCPEPITNALIKRAKHGIFGYTMRPEKFYDVVIDWNKRRNNFVFTKEAITFTPGIVAAINWAVQIYSNEGDEIIVQPPVYYPFFSAITNNGRKIVENTLINKDGKYLMDLELLKSQINEKTKMLILCSPQNPVGRVWTKQELTDLAQICLDNNVLIVSDEIHSDLIMPGYKHTCMASISKEIANNTITCMAPSKTFNIAGLETSIAIIPNKDLYDKFRKFQNGISIQMTNIFGIEAFIAAYSECEDWLEQEIIYIDHNAKYIEHFIQTRLPEFRVIKLEGTYLLWLDCQCLNMNKDELKEFFVKKVRVALDAGDIFGESGVGYMRFNLATPLDNVITVMNNLEKAVKDLK